MLTALSSFLDIPLEFVLLDIAELQRDGAFGRYDNPFERKDFLQYKNTLPPNLEAVFNLLIQTSTSWWVSRILDVPIHHADFTHYGGLFVYNDGDYLKMHVDAGIHPTKHLRKVATALLYLTPAELRLGHGIRCTTEDPYCYEHETHSFQSNTLVLFTNHDNAWHAVPTVHGTPRVVLTVSYLAPPEFTDPDYTNQRTRAYFCRTTWEADTPELQALREARASEQHHTEVYRTGEAT